MAELFSQQVERLHQEAALQVGADDFGPQDYREGLGVLLAALDAGPGLTPLGQAASLDLIRDGLVGRLHSQAGWSGHPTWRQAVLDRPLFIMGLPRSGTTALHKLMSMDPQFQSVERWLLGNPMPRPPRDAWAAEPLYQASVTTLQRRSTAAPDAQKAHPIVAGEPDECLIPMSQSFISNWWGSTLDVRAYDDWFMLQDETASYERYANNLRLIGLTAPDRRWLLKNPSHIMGIDALMNVFPDAGLIHTVRHPAQTIPSLTSLLANIRGPLMDHAVDRADLGGRQLTWYGEAVRRVMAADRRDPGRILTVDFRDLVADPMRVVRSIYAWFDLELTAQTEERMVRWNGENRQGSHGAHIYSLSDASLGLEDIDKVFSAYIDQFDLRR